MHNFSDNNSLPIIYLLGTFSELTDSLLYPPCLQHARSSGLLTLIPSKHHCYQKRIVPVLLSGIKAV